MKLSFRTTHLLGYMLVVTLVGVFSVYAGLSFISQTVVNEAQLRVRKDMNSAWAEYEKTGALLRMAVEMISEHGELRNVLTEHTDPGNIVNKLELLCVEHGWDYMTLLDKDGFIFVGRDQFAPPYRQGRRDPIIDKAFDGQAACGTILLSHHDIVYEYPDLAAVFPMQLVTTKHARPTDRVVEDRGMVLEAATPVLGPHGKVQGVLYGGILLNHRNSLVDRIRNAVFGKELYKGKPLGTVTIFLGDVRVATNVIEIDSTRAIGTRVSDEVYTRVLEQGEHFYDRAFVVNDWYLSAYDPIMNPDGQTIGIFYVGLLEKKYLDYKSVLVGKFLGIIFVSMLLSVGFAFYLSSNLRRPVGKLVEATRKISAGQLNTRVDSDEGCLEMVELARSFNLMFESLETHNKQLSEATVALKQALAEADEKNHAYLEMLGFVTHELKSPLASIVFAIGSLRERLLGPLTDQQEAVLKASSASADYLNFTIANYLNLSRLEESELKLNLGVTELKESIVEPVIELLSEIATDNKMQIVCHIQSHLQVKCDRDLLTSAVQNLLSNAIKYGQKGGLIEIGTESEVDNRFIGVYIFNEGSGFEPHEAEELFNRFTRFASKNYNTKSGTGLGLFVAREIIEKHGGRIWAGSEPGKWAKFTFTIPIEFS
ncbi:MAG: cache domain-containing protein [candidate division Zixibacteria bacterium]|nr:cache domain-containing protein [candidate division Zixibacteria bacterium]